MKRTVSGIMLTLLFIGMLTLAFNIQPAKSDWTWTETIYIRDDGSVEPDTAPISTANNITYTLIDNIVGDVPRESSAIVVERDNIVFDGAGYILQGTGVEDSKGIYLSGRSNVTTKNMEIKQFWHGIVLSSSSNNTISGNNITANLWDAIVFDDSSNNSISGNNITNNAHGIYLSSNYNSIYGNNIIDNNGLGISLDWYSSHNKLCRNNITNNYYGIYLSLLSKNNTISGNDITNNDSLGIVLDSSSNNTIYENNIINNDCGIYLSGYSSSNNTISGNTITNNAKGINICYSSNNLIFHNNFIDNTQQVDSTDSTNTWDDGYPSGGNFWSDYTGVDLFSGSYQNETGSDGIGDTPYTKWGILDYYPFMSRLDLNPPIADAGPDQRVYEDSLVIFDGSASWDDVGIVRYEWDFGDGTSGTGMTTNHTYTEPETYTVTLTVWDAAGKNDTDSMTVTVLIKGDVNGDGIVNIIDGVIIGVAFGSRPEDAKWNPIADIVPDNFINIQDIVLWATHFGETS